MLTQTHIKNQTYNKLQISFYARQYYVLGLETRDHVTANIQTYVKPQPLTNTTLGRNIKSLNCKHSFNPYRL